MTTDIDVASLRGALRGQTVGCRIFHYKVIGSTMYQARELAEEGWPEGTVAVAEGQVDARGRFNRRWVSPTGRNLTFSVLLRPQTDQLAYVNMAATMSVADAVAESTGLSPNIKWPNDVRIRGRKLAGILVESSIESRELKYAILGVGLNVNFDPDEVLSIAGMATSLQRELGRSLDRTEVFESVLRYLDDWYGQVKDGRSLTEEWSSRLDTLGKSVQVKWQDQVFEGRAHRVTDQGNLVLARPDGSTFTVPAGEVTFQM